MTTGLLMKKVYLIALSTLVLVGCEYLKQKQAPLTGDRISVLQNERSLSADAEISGHRILLPAPSLNLAWPQSGGYANHAMHHIQVSDNLKKIWSINIGEGTGAEERLSGEPVVANEVVYTIDTQTNINAYDVNTGKHKWHVGLTPEDDDDGHINGGLAIDGGRLFITTGFAQVISLNAETGKEIWRKSLDAPMRAAPTVRGGRVFVITLNNKTFALNAKTGEELWTHSGLTESASILGAASPAVDRGIVVIPYSSGQLVALQAESGRLLWEENLSTVRSTELILTLADIRGRPVIDRNSVIAMSHGGQMVSIDLRTGRRNWSRDIGGLESPWVAGDYIYAITNHAEVVCISRENGKAYWVRALPRFEDPENLEGLIIWTGPILASDRLIIAGSNGEAMSISPYSGKILGILEMPDQVSIPPIIANGSVFFLSDDAQLVAYK
jgi:outer membrane protein assembly factor BamB